MYKLFNSYSCIFNDFLIFSLLISNSLIFYISELHLSYVINIVKEELNMLVTIISWIITFLILIAIGSLIVKLKNKK